MFEVSGMWETWWSKAKGYNVYMGWRWCWDVGTWESNFKFTVHETDVGIFKVWGMWEPWWSNYSKTKSALMQSILLLQQVSLSYLSLDNPENNILFQSISLKASQYIYLDPETMSFFPSRQKTWRKNMQQIRDRKHDAKMTQKWQKTTQKWQKSTPKLFVVWVFWASPENCPHQKKIRLLRGLGLYILPWSMTAHPPTMNAPISLLQPHLAIARGHRLRKVPVVEELVGRPADGLLVLRPSRNTANTSISVCVMVQTQWIASRQSSEQEQVNQTGPGQPPVG